jgi:hypothetical protein
MVHFSASVVLAIGRCSLVLALATARYSLVIKSLSFSDCVA